MVLATKAFMQTGGNFGSPKFDLGNCVLWLPLYRDDMQGSTIYSKGVYGVPIHTCTVLGAVWRPDGRFFDNSDDTIDCGASSLLKITGDMTLWARVKWIAADFPSVATNYFIFWSGVYQTAGIWFRVQGSGVLLFATNQVAAWTTLLSNTPLVKNTWYTVGVVKSGATSTMYLNGTPDGSGAISNPVVATENLLIGNAVSQSLGGILAEGGMCNRALSAGGMMGIHEACVRRSG